MKKLILPLISIFVLVGCAKPFSESTISKNGLQEQQTESPTLIKLEVSEVENPIVEALPVSPETVEITNSQTPDPIQVPSSVIETDPVINTVESTGSQAVEQNQNSESSPVTEVLPEAVKVEQTESSVIEEVVYVSEELKASDSPKEEVPTVVSESIEAQEVEKEVVAEEKEEVQVDEEMKKEIESVTYGDKTQDVTMVTYQKKEGKLESYIIYSQNDENASWVKEFTVFVENGKVQLIQSHNKNKIENFAQELEEIVSLEHKFKEKIKSSDVDNIKEVSVSQFVKNKKDKKTSKIKNKKFGKKSKKKNKNKH